MRGFKLILKNRPRITESFAQKSGKIALCIILALEPAFLTAASAQEVVIDPSGNVGFAPTMQRTTRPQVVDVARPNSGGVSVNQYTRFDVTSSGVVLNNSTGSRSTQVAGTIAGNANLAGTPATTILNEVRSTSGSSLNGRIEVAGTTAHVIVANPNGMSCNGCSFINAGAVTLSTGQPVVDGGSVRLDVTRGAVTIGRNGLNGAATGVGQVNLIGRTVVIDGKVTSAGTLNVQSGGLSWDATNAARIGTLAPAGAAGTSYGVDATAFGAMEAGRITVVGNETGLGVRSRGALTAGAQGLSVQAPGDVSVRSASSQGAVSLRSDSGTVTVERDVSSSSAAVTLTGRNGVTTDATSGLFGATGITIGSSHGGLSFGGDIQSGAGVTVTATRGTLSFGGSVAAAGAVTATAAGAASVSGATIVADRFSVTGSGAETGIEDSAIFTRNNVTVDTQGFYLGSDVVVAGLTEADTSTLVVTAAGAFRNGADLRNYTSASVTYGGALINDLTGIIEAASLVLPNGRAVENRGVLSGVNAITGSLASFLNTETGAVLSKAVTLTTTGDFVNRGVIAVEGDLRVTAGTKIENAGAVQALRAYLTAPTILSLGTGDMRLTSLLQVTASSAFTNNGLIGTTGSFIANTPTFTNAGSITGEVALTATGDRITNDGTLVSARNIALNGAVSVINRGSIGSYLTASLTSAGYVENRGELMADTTLTVNGGAFDNIGAAAQVRALTGAINSASVLNSGRILLTSNFTRSGNINAFRNDGLFATAGSISITGRDAASSITMGTDGVLVAGLQANDPTQALIAGRVVTLNAANLSFSGQIAAGGNIAITGGDALTLNGKIQTATGGLTLTSADLRLASASDIYAGGNSVFNAATRLRNEGKLVIGGRLDLLSTAGSLTNSGGMVIGSTYRFDIAGAFSNTGTFASEGGTTINAGSISSTGALQSRSAMVLNSAAGLTLGGSIVAKNTVALNAAGTVQTLAGSQLSATRLNVTGTSFISRGNIALTGTSRNDWLVSDLVQTFGLTHAAGALKIDANRLTTQAGSLLSSNGSITATMIPSASTGVIGSISHSGVMTGSAITLSGTTVSGGTASQITATGALNATATAAVNLFGETSAATMALNGASVELRGRVFADLMTLTASGAITTRDGVYARDRLTATAGGSFINLGYLEAVNKLAVTANAFDNRAGAEARSNDIAVTTDAWASNAGKMFGARDISFNAGTNVTNVAGGSIDAGSLGVTAAGNFTNSGTIDVFGFFGNVTGSSTNNSVLRATTYLGLTGGAFTNAAAATLWSDNHIYIRSTGAVRNFATTVVHAKALDIRAASFENTGQLRAREVINIADITGTVTNSGVLYAPVIAVVAGGSLSNSGTIGQTSNTSLPRATLVNLASGSWIDNDGAVRSAELRLQGTGHVTIGATGVVQATNLAALTSANAGVTNLGTLSAKDIQIVAANGVDNQGSAVATAGLNIEAGRLLNRSLNGSAGRLQGVRVAIEALTDGISNTGTITGTTEIGLRARAGDVYNNGTLSSPKIGIVSDTGNVWLPANITTSGSLIAQGRAVGVEGSITATNAITLVSTAYNVTAHGVMATRTLVIEAAQDLRTTAGRLRGSVVTQVIADDIERTDIAETNRKLGAITGAAGDVHVQLRTGSLGTYTPDDTSGYEVANFDTTGSVALISKNGSAYLRGTIKADKDILISAKGTTGLRSATLDAGGLLHLYGGGYVKNYGSLNYTAGNTVQIEQGQGWFYTDDWLKRTVDHNLVVFAKRIVVNSDHRFVNRDVVFRASENIAQRDRVISARGLTYSAGGDILVEFDPNDWREANPNAVDNGDWLDIATAGLRGRTLQAQTRGMTIYADGDIRLTSGKIHTEGDLNITAQGNILSEPIYLESYEDSRPAYMGWSFDPDYKAVLPGHSQSKVVLTEFRAYENMLSAKGSVAINAGRDIDLIGSRVTAVDGNLSIYSNAGTITMAAAPGFWMYNHQTTTVKRSWFGLKKTYTTTTYDAYKDIYKRTQLNAANGTISVVSRAPRGTGFERIISAGTEMSANNVRLSTLPASGSTTLGGSITLGSYAERNDVSTRTRSKSSFIGITYRNRTNSSARTALLNTGNDLLADDIIDISSGNNLTIQGGSLAGQRINISAVGNLNIMALINSTRVSNYSERQNLVTITTIQEGFDRQTAQFPQISSPNPITFNIGGSVHISGQEGASLNAQLLTVIGSRTFGTALAPINTAAATSGLAAQAQVINTDYTRALALPGAANGAQYAYLDTLVDQYGATYDTIQLRDHSWYDKQVRLTPAFQALLSVSVGYMTGGLGLTVFQQAALNSLITGGIEGAITGQLDPGVVLRNALLAGTSAYVTNVITSNFQIGTQLGLSDASPFANDLRGSFSPQAIVNRAGDRIVAAVVDNAVFGRPVFDGLDSVGRTFLVTEAMSVAQFGIGELGMGQESFEGSLQHILLHGGLGCVAIQLMNGTCASGFFAGASQAVLAGSSLSIEEKQRLAPLAGAAAGFLFADGKSIGVSYGATIAQTGIVNNYLTHLDVIELKTDLARCRQQNGGRCEGAARDAIIQKFRDRSAQNDFLLVNECTRSLECVNERLSNVATTASGVWSDVDMVVRHQLLNVIEPSSYVNAHIVRLPQILEIQNDFAAANCGGVWNDTCAARLEASTIETMILAASVAAGAGLTVVAVRAIVTRGAALCVRSASCWAGFLGREVSTEVLAEVSAGGFTAVGGVNLAENVATAVTRQYAGLGAFRPVNESMSAAARSYQDAIPGAISGQTYFVGNVRFDSFDPSIGLLEAKADYSFMFEASGALKSWAQSSYSDMLDQAARQLSVAGNTPVVWYVQTPALRAQLSQDFNRLGLNIELRQ
ncbi:MAG: two-partner secretion domain-containing protein [Thalassococcus profundi]|uniref:two-partner secretion domain-containing protein n=1 Tax=Thalassococcus profundi TaxID=2282382 RepID=UPI0040590AD4